MGRVHFIGGSPSPYLANLRRSGAGVIGHYKSVLPFAAAHGARLLQYDGISGTSVR